MDVFVINLEKDIDRKSFIESQLSNLNISFEFVKGTLGKDISKDEINMIYDKKKTFKNLCRELTKSEIGCAISHIGIYRKIVNENIPYALILEDDVCLTESLPEILQQLEGQLDHQKPDLILLSNAIVDDKQKESFYPNIYPFKSGFFTSSYILTNLSAKILIDDLFPLKDVADCWNRLKKNKVLNIYAIKSALITQNQEEFGSSTTTDIRANIKKTFMNIFTYKVCRLFWIMINAIMARYNKLVRPYRGLYKELQ